MERCCFCIQLNTASFLIGLLALVSSTISLYGIISTRIHHDPKMFSYSLMAFSSTPAAIVFLVTLCKPKHLLVKKRFALVYLVSQTVGIIVGYINLLLYVTQHETDNVVCLPKGCFNARGLLLVVAGYSVVSFALIIYFDCVLWARYYQF